MAVQKTAQVTARVVAQNPTTAKVVQSTARVVSNKETFALVAHVSARVVTTPVGEGQEVAATTGHVAFTGYAPGVVQTITVEVAADTGHVAVTGYAPTVSQTNNVAIAATTGHVAFTGYAPTVDRSQNVNVYPETGHVVFTGYVPRVYRAWPRPPVPFGPNIRKLGQISLPRDYPSDYDRRLSIQLYSYLTQIVNTVNALIDEAQTVSYATLYAVDSIDTTVAYYGRAPLGSDEAAGVWQIQRLSFDGTGAAFAEWPGTAGFSYVWDDRESLTYS